MLLSARVYPREWKRGYRNGRNYTRQHPTKPLDAEVFGMDDRYDQGFAAGTADELDLLRRRGVL